MNYLFVSFLYLGSLTLVTVLTSPEGQSYPLSALSLPVSQTQPEPCNTASETPNIPLIEGEDACAFTPDGRFIALGHGRSIRIFNRTTGQLTKEIAVPRKEARTLIFSPNGEYLAGAGNFGTIWVWNWRAEGQLVTALVGHDKDVNSLAFSPNGAYVASGSDDETVRVWEWRKRREIEKQDLSIKGMAGWFRNNHIRAVNFSPDGQQLVCGGTDNTVWVWSWSDNTKPALSYTGHTDDVNQVSFLPDGESVLSASDDETVQMWRLTEQPRNSNRQFQAKDKVTAMAYLPGYIIIGQRNGKVQIVDERSSDTLKTFDTGHRKLRSLTLSYDGWYLLSVGSEEKVRIWEWSSGLEQKRLMADRVDPRQGIECIAISPDSRLLVAGGQGGQNLRSWKVKDGSQQDTYKGFKGTIKSVEFNADGQNLAISSSDSTVSVFDTELPNIPINQVHLPTQALSVNFSPNGRWLAIGRSDGVISLWDWREDTYPTDSLKMPAGSVESLAFYDNKYLVAGGTNRTIFVWDWQLKTVAERLRGHTSSIYTLAFSPDKRYLVSGSPDQSVRVWDWNTKTCIDTVLHTAWVRSVCFSTDGEFVVSSDQGGTILRWAINSDESPRVIAATCKPITAVRFSPDRKYVFSGSNEVGGRVSVWWSGLTPVVMDAESDIYLSWVGRPPAKVSTYNYSAHALLVGDNYGMRELKDSVKLYLNQQPVVGAKTLGIQSIGRKGGGFDFEKTVQLTEGTNSLQWKLSRPGFQDVVSAIYTVRYTPQLKPNLFVYAFGIVNQSPDLGKLEYTVSDATELVKALKQQEGKLFGNIEVHLADTPDETTCHKMRETFEELGQPNDKILSKDMLIVFISGHGESSKLGFRIAGSDYSTRKPSTTSINLLTDVYDPLAELDCKKLFLLDACYSGDARIGKRSTPTQEQARQILAGLPPQSILITSSTGDQNSWEDKSWGHGAFTKALLDAIAGKADQDNSQSTTIQELFSYIEQVVPRMVQQQKKGVQMPQFKKSDAGSRLDQVPLFWHVPTN